MLWLLHLSRGSLRNLFKGNFAFQNLFFCMFQYFWETPFIKNLIWNCLKSEAVINLVNSCEKCCSWMCVRPYMCVAFVCKESALAKLKSCLTLLTLHHVFFAYCIFHINQQLQSYCKRNISWQDCWEFSEFSEIMSFTSC